MRLEDAKSGLVIGNTSITLNKEKPEAHLTRDQIIELPFPFDGVVFPNTGKYEAIALFNNQVVGRIPFAVSPMTVQPKAPYKARYHLEMTDEEVIKANGLAGGFDWLDDPIEDGY